VALVGDIVRRLCLLNPESLFPCLEGDGVLLIDAIDHQLDQNMAQVILKRLNQAFPRLQIIASGNRSELLEQASEFQCLKLENKQLSPIQLEPLQHQFDVIYQNLANHEATSGTIEPIAAEPQDLSVAELFTQIQQQLSPEQQQHLITLLSAEDDASSANPLT
jgi:predicted ATP-binding protein involved in virulence